VARALVEQRCEGPLDDAIDDELGGEVGARIAPAGGRREDELTGGVLEAVIEQPLVDRSQVTGREVAVVDEVSADPVEGVERRSQQTVRHGAALEPRMASG